MLNAELFERCVAAASMAPSAHNTQPVRWRRVDGTTVEVVCDGRRRLAVGDPTGRDQCMAAGAAIEGFALELGRAGGQVAAVVATGADTRRAEPVVIARLQVAGNGTVDPLSEWVDRRQSHRGKFARSGVAALQALHDELPDDTIRIVSDPKARRRFAGWVDRSSLATFKDSAMFDELWAWLRLTPAHPDYARDGLNADALALGWLERQVGPWLMRPAMFRRLQALGMEGVLLSEAAQTRSATALLVLAPPRAWDCLALGRWFYRVWLRLTRCGMAACPMSVLADHEPIAALIRSECAIEESAALINVLRVGPMPAKSYVRARLPPAELIVD